jgi:hypothetical protein
LLLFRWKVELIKRIVKLERMNGGEVYLGVLK